MEIAEYQEQAWSTDQQGKASPPYAPKSDDHLVVPLLGLVGEVGTLHTEYKKFLRDGPAYSGFDSNLAEELGDVLWYVSNLASKFGLSLEDVAAENLKKVKNRWPHEGSDESVHLPDAGYPADQQLPRQFEIYFAADPPPAGGGPAKVQGFWNGETFGDQLDDNAIDQDGYRFHDAFHLAYVAHLGWSPVLRKFFKAKRTGDVDRVKDGGRAKVYEEAIAAIVYEHASEVDWFRNPAQIVDFSVLKQIGQLTSKLDELDDVPLRRWEQAILAGFEVWNQLVANEGGVVIGNLESRTLSYRAIPDDWERPSVSDPESDDVLD